VNNFLLIIFLVTVSFLEAKELKVVFSRTTPPYVFDTGGGINFDIVKESLEYKNHTIEPVYVNIARGVEMFKSNLVDANTLLQETTDVKGHYSDFFIEYQNCVFTLEDSNIHLETLDDIKNYHTIGFQNAYLYLGVEFEKITQMAKENYTELADQKKQVHMFYKNRTQAVVLDKNIFQYYSAMLKSEGKITNTQKVVEQCFFNPTKYQVAFKSQTIRDDFNEGLKHIMKNGRYDAIIQKYSKNYFKTQK
jgi:polar amino acid transport system substrate-binding protein